MNTHPRIIAHDYAVRLKFLRSTISTQFLIPNKVVAGTGTVQDSDVTDNS
jgi:hypothetical protein